MSKKVIAVLFGGKSTEHEISKMSVTTILDAISLEKYHVIPVFITKNGSWFMYEGPIENIKQVQWEKFGTPVVLSPDASHKGLIRLVGDKARILPIDIVFPVLHGLNGEDGTIQGLCELAEIPYVGCGVMTSSVCMDKTITKVIIEDVSPKIPQVKYATVFMKQFNCEEKKKEIIKQIRYQIGYPCFVKPANAGSSVGVSKAKNKDELEKAILLAGQFDRKVIVEKAIFGREVECAVLGTGDGELLVSSVGEVIAAAEFYDYEAKYHNAESKNVIPADLPAKTIETVRECAEKVFRAVDGKGLSRIDFFVENETGKVIFNEINTFPGFTAISMYAKLMNDYGLTNEQIVDKLIDIALEKSCCCADSKGDCNE